MFDEEYNPKQREQLETLFRRLGLEARVSGEYKWDFSKRNLHFETGKSYPHNNTERGEEEISWVFYSGQVPNRKDANPLIVLGEYYGSGMRHDIVVLHKMNRFPLENLTNSSYLYQDEIDANSVVVLDEEAIWPYPEAAHFSRLDIMDIQAQIGSTAILIMQEGDKFVLDEPVDFSRTTSYFQKFLAEPYQHGLERVPSAQEITNFASDVWSKIVQG